MPISERMLRKWRKEALEQISKGPLEGTIAETIKFGFLKVFSERILKLTAELLDQHLLKK